MMSLENLNYNYYHELIFLKNINDLMKSFEHLNCPDYHEV